MSNIDNSKFDLLMQRLHDEVQVRRDLLLIGPSCVVSP